MFEQSEEVKFLLQITKFFGGFSNALTFICLFHKQIITCILKLSKLCGNGKITSKFMLDFEENLVKMEHKIGLVSLWKNVTFIIDTKLSLKTLRVIILVFESNKFKHEGK